MGMPRKLDYDLIHKLANEEKKSPSQIAKQLGKPLASIRYVLSHDNRHKAISSTITFEQGRENTLRHLDTVSQLQTINQNMHSILELIMKAIKGDKSAQKILNQDDKYKRKDPMEIAIKASAEIREQLEAQNKIFETLYSIQQTKDFQDMVMETMEEMQPGLRSRFLERLKQKRLMHSAIEWKETKR